jgi:zinc transporter, ZIP family
MDLIPEWLIAGFWGWVSGSALLIGAMFGYLLSFSQRTVATIMAFGSGVLISALTLELMDEAYKSSGFLAPAVGFIAGALLYTGANWVIERRGAAHRKRSGSQQNSESESPGSGSALAVGALLDGIPESIAIGLSMVRGHGVSVAAVVAIFISNLPEGLSSSSGMKRAGRSKSYVLSLWLSICLASGVASIVGYSVFSEFPVAVADSTTALAAGAILAMISDTMLPEAYEQAGTTTGLVTVLGFLISFVLSKAA